MPASFHECTQGEESRRSGSRETKNVQFLENHRTKGGNCGAFRRRYLIAISVIGFCALSTGGAECGMVRLDFNADGQFPYEECTDLVRNVTDEAAEDVIDGCWIGDTTRGLARLYYAGNLPAVATTDQALPMSINVSNVGELPDALAELFQGNFAQRLAA